jgi:hypothetical protein
MRRRFSPEVLTFAGVTMILFLLIWAALEIGQKAEAECNARGGVLVMGHNYVSSCVAAPPR